MSADPLAETEFTVPAPGVNPSAVVILLLVNASVPPNVKLPADVIDPVNVNPLTVPVPVTLVTVPTPAVDVQDVTVPFVVNTLPALLV